MNSTNQQERSQASCYIHSWAFEILTSVNNPLYDRDDEDDGERDDAVVYRITVSQLPTDHRIETENGSDRETHSYCSL